MSNLQSLEQRMDRIDYKVISDDKDKRIAELETKLAESEKKLNQYPYKNEVIEEQYEELKDAITFLMLNNIKDQEQLNYSIDVLCEKHKARIRDIENGICKIEQLEKQLAEKEKENTKLKTTNDRLYKKNKKLENQIVESNIRFYKKGAVEQLEKVKEFFLEEHRDEEMDTDYIITKDAGQIADYLLDQINGLTEI